MSACPDQTLLLHGLADGELDAANALRVEAHLETCPGCRAALERIRAVRAALACEGVAYPPPAGLEARVLAALDAASPQPAPVRMDLRRHVLDWRWATGALTGLAAGLVLAVAVGLPQPRGGDLQDQLVASHVRSLMASHLADVATSDQHQVKPWFNGKIDFAPPVPELAGRGFPLVGGRLDYVDRQSVAAIVYRRRLHTINLFVRPASDAPAAGPAVSTEDGYNLVRWTAGGLEFFAVSDLNAKELQEFAAAFRTAS
jgi:anti-sigma factor RsiW